MVSSSWGHKWEPLTTEEQQSIFGLVIKASLADGEMSKEESDIIFSSFKALEFKDITHLKQNIFFILQKQIL